MSGNLSGFNAAEVEPNSAFKPLPAGEYQAIISESEMKPIPAIEVADSERPTSESNAVRSAELGEQKRRGCPDRERHPVEHLPGGWRPDSQRLGGVAQQADGHCCQDPSGSERQSTERDQGLQAETHGSTCGKHR